MKIPDKLATGVGVLKFESYFYQCAGKTATSKNKTFIIFFQIYLQGIYEYFINPNYLINLAYYKWFKYIITMSHTLDTCVKKYYITYYKMHTLHKV